MTPFRCISSYYAVEDGRFVTVIIRLSCHFPPDANQRYLPLVVEKCEETKFPVILFVSLLLRVQRKPGSRYDGVALGSGEKALSFARSTPAWRVVMAWSNLSNGCSLSRGRDTRKREPRLHFQPRQSYLLLLYLRLSCSLPLPYLCSCL